MKSRNILFIRNNLLNCNLRNLRICKKLFRRNILIVRN